MKPNEIEPLGVPNTLFHNDNVVNAVLKMFNDEPCPVVEPGVTLPKLKKFYQERLKLL